MGPNLMRRPPKYVQAFLDRHGKPRYYLRRPGHKPRTLAWHALEPVLHGDL